MLSIEAATLQLPTDGHVRDVKFADDHSILVLYRMEGMCIQYSLTFAYPQTLASSWTLRKIDHTLPVVNVTSLLQMDPSFSAFL